MFLEVTLSPRITNANLRESPIYMASRHQSDVNINEETTIAHGNIKRTIVPNILMCVYHRTHGNQAKKCSGPCVVNKGLNSLHIKYNKNFQRNVSDLSATINRGDLDKALTQCHAFFCNYAENHSFQTNIWKLCNKNMDSIRSMFLNNQNNEGDKPENHINCPPELQLDEHGPYGDNRLHSALLNAEKKKKIKNIPAKKTPYIRKAVLDTNDKNIYITIEAPITQVTQLSNSIVPKLPAHIDKKCRSECHHH